MAASTETAVVAVNTILDVVNSYTSLDDKAKYVWAANILARKCPFFQDMPMKPSNQIMSHIGARVSYLPTLATRGFNEGVSPTATHSVQYTEGIAMIEDYGEVDKVLCDIQNNPGQWRQEKDAQKMEAMAQTAENLIIYGSKATDPNAWNGLTTRFNSLTNYPNGDTTWPYNVKGAGGTGNDGSSIWIIGWGDKVYGIYPPNLVAGIKTQDLGEVTVVSNTLAAPKYMQAYRTFMGLYFGLVIEDERYVQRIANIELSGAINIFDPEHLVEMINNVPDRDNLVIYAPRSIVTQMDIAMMNKSNAYYNPGRDMWGRPTTEFRGIPVRMADKLTTETTI